MSLEDTKKKIRDMSTEDLLKNIYSQYMKEGMSRYEAMEKARSEVPDKIKKLNKKALQILRSSEISKFQFLNPVKCCGHDFEQYRKNMRLQWQSLSCNSNRLQLVHL